MMKRISMIACCAAIALHGEVFTLGQVEVVENVSGAQKSDTNVVIIDEENMQKNEIKRLSEVAYSTPGLQISKGGGGRAEQTFYVRGFNARRVPVFIDGIPVYIPYDGYIDYGRFTTFDLSRIVISKGASSVLYGPNTMGGAINLVTKKPSKELEGEIGYGFEAGKSSKTVGNNIDFNIGTKQELFYLQAGGSFFEDRGQQLSSKFNMPINDDEDGGRRDNSVQRDKKFNFKIGFTPNETDEYAIAYNNQKGRKQAPRYAGRYKAYSRYWDWPMWDKESIYFLSHTQILNSLYVNTKAYYDKFKNDLRSFDDKNYNTQKKRYAFNSHYRDHSYGFGAEIGGDVSDQDTLKFAANYKFDEHKEHNDGEPVQTTRDAMYSFALENTYKFTDYNKLILGIDYDIRDSKKAEKYGSILAKKPHFYSFADLKKETAFNYQVAYKHSFDGNDELSLSYAKKTYFPSMKDRYSERFGRTFANPALRPEVANHYEIDYQRIFGETLKIETAIFYSRVKDAFGLRKETRNGQTRDMFVNINRATHKGFEFSTGYFATKDLELGGNYSYIVVTNDKSDAKVYNLPKHKAFLYADYKITPKLFAYVSQKISSGKYVLSEKETRLAGFGVTNLKLTYKPIESLSIEAGVSNLFNKNYEYDEGYPEEGRVFFSNIRYKF